MSAGGTVALVGRALARALAPLRSALEPDQVVALLADLGLGLPDAALADPGLAAALAAARDAAGELPGLADRLTAAIAGDDPGATAALGAEAITRVATLRGRLGAVGTALGGLLPTVPAGELAELPRRLVDLMVVAALEQSLPGLANGLALAGLIERHASPGVPGDPARPPAEVRRLRPDRLVPLLTDPTGHLRTLYGWGGPGFDGAALLAQLASAAGHSGLPAVLTTGPAGEPLLDLLAGAIAVEPGGLRGELRFAVPAGAAVDLPVGTTGWRLRLSTDPALPAGLVARLTPPGSLAVTAGGPVSGSARAAVSRTATPPGSRGVLLGRPGGTRLEAGTIAARAGADLTVDGAVARATPAAELAIEDGRFVLDLGAAGALLTALVPGGTLTAAVDLALVWADGKVRLRGSAGLRATFPVNLSIGPAEVRSVTVGLAPAGTALPVEISATVAAVLGPLAMLIDGVGLTATLGFPPGGGALGPLDVDLAFRPPSGIGLALDAGPVQGGGYLAVADGGRRFAGVLQVKLTFLGITAFGIYEEAPGGGASFVAVLGIRFLPGIQLGFGFAVTGVGGMVGFNRRADVDLLRERLATGAAGNVLFCDDPVKNAPALLGDLAAFFPAAKGSFIVGPTLQIGWLAPIVRLDLALLIELPGPSKIIILGSVKVLIGADETIALLYLRMDFLGVLDFEQRLVSLDAYLVNSHALGVFRLTGGMAFRLSYGDNPYVLLSIGGFHPRFDPGPLNVPAIPRVGAVLDLSVVADIYLRLELYVAFTSNTLQLGAKVEAGLELGPISAHGYLQFDALIQFRPFAFDIEFAAGFSVEVFDVSLCSVDVSGRLTGPGPLVVHARARVSLLFVKVSGSATVELGGHDGDAPQPVPSIVRALEPELARAANLRAEGADASIVPRSGQPVTGVLVSPLGSLVWEQKRAPLDTLVDRFEGAPLIGQHELALTPPPGWVVTEARDWFSPGTFTALDLKASQTLNNATFQELRSGIRIGSGGDRSAPNPKPYTPRIDLVKRPVERLGTALVGSYLTPALAAALGERDSTPPVSPGPAKVAVAPETFDVVAGSGGTLAAGETPFQAFQLSRLSPGAVAVPSSDVVVVL